MHMYHIALAVIGMIFIWRMSVGFRKGMVREIASLIAMAVAVLCIILIFGAVGSYLERELGKVFQITAALLGVCLIYRLANIFIISLELISKLPVIKGLDKLLGAAVGLAEGGIIVGVLVYFLKNWGSSALGHI